MTKKKRIIVIAAMSAAVLGLLVWLVSPMPPREPVYNGRTLTQLAAKGGIDQQGFREAVREIGTNAIPTLLRLLRANDSPLKVRLLGIMRRQHWFKMQHANPSDLNCAGYYGFAELRGLAAPAVPELVRIYKQYISQISQVCTADALSAIGPDAKMAVPAMLQEAVSTNANARNLGFNVLANIHDNPDVLVPLFIKGLHDSSPNVQFNSAYGLGEFGPAARAAAPALIDFIQNGGFPPPRFIAPAMPPGHDIMTVALDALEKIDPTAAEKLTAELPKDGSGN